MKNKIYISFLVYLIFSFTLYNCAGKKPEVKPGEEIKIYNSEAIRHFMSGEIYSLHGDFAMAVLEFQDAARIDSNSTTIYASIGNAYINLGKYDNAKKYLRKAVALDTANYMARKQLADINFAEGNITQAEQEYDALSGKLDDNLDLEYKLAEIYLRTNRVAEALQKYEDIFRKDRSQIGALERAAEILFLSKNFDKAARYFDFLVQLAPDNTEYLKTRADLAIINQDIDKAIATYKKLIELLPDDQKIRTNLGEILSQVREEKYNPAEYLNNMVEKYPDNIENYKNLAYFYVNNDRIDEALNLLLETKNKFPKDADVMFIIGSLYREKGDTDQALEFLDSALVYTDDRLQILHLKATLLEEVGRYELSDSLYAYLIKEYPEDPVAMNNYAYSLAVRRENLEVADKLVNKALELVPDNASYLDTKGWVLYQRGKYAEAEKYLIKALEQISTNVEILEHLGDALAKQNKHREAQKYYQKALELDPENETIKQKISQ